MIEDIGVLASDSPVSIDAAFLKIAGYQVFNDAYHVDCRVQVKEAKRLGIRGDVKPKISTIS